ncbi:MAG: efflux transporter outer membrane subunit [Gammaproteobacteria bacterium]|nr:efflux transporter outer membrane subunit [Gammaproteobacteria bacterium]MBU1646731.1 efflux transporter outer membrane subunit [Gammaproteobacteria bacterium]MBU1971765.1 efflux transporter outer membrane subunit [Gammaproteobacteria bacterium]
MLALSGCTSMAPQSAAPVAVDVPANWSATDIPALTGASSLAQWWLRFDDPLLARLVAQALQANSDVKSAEAALRQARALRDASAAALFPAVGSSASAQRSKSGGNSAVNTFKAGLDASWELDIFGANRSALAASEATAQASAASLGNVQVSITAEVALNYITLRAAQARLMIAEDNLSSQQETLQITQWRLQAGLVTSLEAEQARAATEQTRAQLPVLQTTIEQTRHALAVLTGEPPAALSGVLAEVGRIPQAADDLVLSFPAETLRQRPDVRAAEHQVMAALGRVSQADAARMPKFNLGGSLGLSALTLGTLTNGASAVSALLASLSLPVFDGGALRAQVRAQQATLEQARVAYQATILTALKDVEDALVALRGDRERLLRLQNAAEAAGNAALMARQRYSSGLVDFQIVLETQRTQLSTQDSVASVRADLGSDHVRLYKALGGGWRPDDVDATATSNENATRTNPK